MPSAPPGKGRGKSRVLDRVELRATNETPSHEVEIAARPVTRGECREEARPCPWVGCRHHLYLDINPETGSIKFNYPDLEPWELSETCSLDVAERGGVTLEETGAVLNITRERVRQIEVQAMLKIKFGSASSDELGSRLLALGT